MTEQEAVEGMLFLKEKLYNGIFKDRLECLDEAIKVLEEIKRYRALGLTPELIEAMQGHNIAMINDLAEYQALGTVEELRVARDKQVGKKLRENDECINCGNELWMLRDTGANYCQYCGQKLDWSGEDE